MQAVHEAIALRSQARSKLVGGKQLGFSETELSTAKKQSKQETFLADLKIEVPCQMLIE